MSCIRSSDSDEPEFEQVTLRHPAITNTIAAAARMFMPTANSSPKLRLDFDNNDSLMADADFYSFLNHRNELKSQGERRDLDEDCKDEDQHVSSPLLPPSPAFTNAGGEIANTQHGTIDDARCRLEHLAVGTEKKNSTSSQDVNTDDSSDRSSTDMEMKIRPVPRPSSILPRDGTVTALPGSTMQTPGIDESKKGDHASPVPSTIASIMTANNTVSASTMMPPPPLPATPTPTSKHYSRPFRPATPLSIPAKSSVISAQESDQSSKQTKKRKLSLNAPILQNVKRLLTPSATRKSSSLSITHITHEETAVNRRVEGAGTGIDDAGKSGRSTPVQGSNNGVNVEKRSTATFPIQRQDHHDTLAQDSRPVTPATSSPASQTMRRMSSIKRTILHPFKSHRRTTTSDSTNTVTTDYTQDQTRAPSEAGSQIDPTSKSGLNSLIIRLRSQISDLTLENRVLKDQIAIVRKDWIDTAQELDLERHRLWEAEMEAFRNGVNLEEMRAELIRLKRGSVPN